MRNSPVFLCFARQVPRGVAVRLVEARGQTDQAAAYLIARIAGAVFQLANTKCSEHHESQGDPPKASPVEAPHSAEEQNDGAERRRDEQQQRGKRPEPRGPFPVHVEFGEPRRRIDLRVIGFEQPLGEQKHQDRRQRDRQITPPQSTIRSRCTDRFVCSGHDSLLEAMPRLARRPRLDAFARVPGGPP